MNIYVGNLPHEVGEQSLHELFESFGKVASVKIILDKFSGQSRGFAFVEMPAKTEAQAAITALNGKEFEGRTLTVSEARPQTKDQKGRGGRLGGGRRF